MKYRTLDNKVELQQYWIGVLAVTLLIFILENVGLFSPVRRLFEKGLRPFQEFGVNVVYIVETPYRVSLASYNSYQKIQNLEARYGELAASVGELENLKIENAELRKIAQATASSGQKDKIIMPILGYSQPIVADIQGNFQSGDPVFIEGVFIGRIGKVSQNQAQVLLFSQQFSQPVLATTENGATGLLFGNGKDVILREIPIEKEVTVGQRIFTLGQEGILPNWYVGRIKEVVRHEGSPTQEALIDQGVSFFESKMVEIK